MPANTKVYYGWEENWLYKIDEYDHPEMCFIYCVIHREILVSENVSHVLNEVLRSIIKCITCECIFLNNRTYMSFR